MSGTFRVFAARSLIGAFLFSQVMIAEATWVRGRGNTNVTGTIDHLIEGVPPHPPIPSIATAQFNDGQKGMFAQSDLGNGALRGRAFVAGGNGAAGANPILGETITFNNTTGAASQWDFTFSLEGNVQTGANPFPIVQDFGGGQMFRTTFIQLAFHVFPGHTVGPVGSDNAWNENIGSALFTEVKDIAGFPTEGDLQNFVANLSDEISGSVPLQEGVNTFDVIMLMAVQGNIPSTTDSSFDFNFLNTAQLEIDSPVPFTSDSGLFLTGMNIPEPSSFVLLCLAAVVGSLSRKRRA